MTNPPKDNPPTKGTSLTLDELMSLDPLKMTKENIDDIINHYRTRRAHYEAGGTAKNAPKKSSIDLVALGLKPKTSIIRRI